MQDRHDGKRRLFREKLGPTDNNKDETDRIHGRHEEFFDNTGQSSLDPSPGHRHEEEAKAHVEPAGKAG